MLSGGADVALPVQKCRRGHYTGEGKVGLPPDVAALVTRITKDEVVVLLHNRGKTDTSLIITAGWYGQHQWTSIRVNEGGWVALNSRRALITLAPGATATLTLAIDRFRNEPTLQPQLPQ